MNAVVETCIGGIIAGATVCLLVNWRAALTEFVGLIVAILVLAGFLLGFFGIGHAAVSAWHVASAAIGGMW